MSEMQWRKSSYSEQNEGNCVELAQTPDTTILLRESDDPHVIIATTPAALRALIRGAKTGEFDFLAS